MSITPFKHHYSFENPASVYDEEAMTALELAGRLGAKLNEVIKSQNLVLKDFDTLVEDTIPDAVNSAVADTVYSHIQNGAFNEQIDNYLGEIFNNYVTPEMYGATGDGVHDDSVGIQNAINTGRPVMFGNKTYLCRDIITKGCKNVTLVGSGSTVIKWKLGTTTAGLRDYAGMISDDDMVPTPYLAGGNIHLENLTFDGNGSELTNFQNDNAFGLCVFYNRDNVTVNNVTFTNCHADGLSVRGLRHSLTVTGSKFQLLGLYQPTDGTRNAITVTRNMWDRETETTTGVSSELHVSITNCGFWLIGDECCRADGINNLTMNNCSFADIGQHILETGHMSDTGTYTHQIINCTGKNVTSSLYNTGADGGGAFPYGGKVHVDNCQFEGMAWTGSTARFTRPPRTCLIEGFNTGKLPFVSITNSAFTSTTPKTSLTYENTSYFIYGEYTLIENCLFDYKYINVGQVLPANATLMVRRCDFNITEMAPTYFTITKRQWGHIIFDYCNFHAPMHNLIVDSLGETTIDISNCMITQSYCVLNTTRGSGVRMVNNRFNGPISGRPIHTDNTDLELAYIVATGNIFHTNTIEWGTITNCTANFINITNNSNYNV